jgi:MscS family membrane protein
MFSQLFPPGSSDLPIRIGLALLVIAAIFLVHTLLARVMAVGLSRLTNRPSDETLYSVVVVPARLLLIALALDLVTRILLVGGDATIFMRRLTQTLVILAVFIGVYQLLGQIMSSRSRLYRVTRLAVEAALLPFVRTGLQLILIAILIIIIIQLWGYDVSGLIAGLGLGGLAFSLAAQDTIANLFGFSMIVGDRPFVVGEYIVTPDVEGTVERVGLRSTRVRQNNQAIVTVPNSTIASAKVLNWSRLSRRWIDFKLWIHHRATAEQIEELMRRIRAMLATREKLDPGTIQVQLVDFNTSGLGVMVRAYVNLTDWLPFIQEQEQVYLNILRIVQKMELDVAFPGQSVYIRQVPDLSQDIQAGLQAAQLDGHHADVPAVRSTQGEQPR